MSVKIQTLSTLRRLCGAGVVKSVHYFGTKTPISSAPVLLDVIRSVPSARTAIAMIHSRHYPTQTRDEYIVKSEFPPVELPNEDMFTALYDRSRNWPTKDAIECGVTGRKYSYNDVIDSSLRWSAALLKLLPDVCAQGKQPTVAILSNNCPEYPIVILGCYAVGGLVTTVSSAYTRAEVTRQLLDSETQVVVVAPHLEALVIEAIKKLGKALPILVLGTSNHGHLNLLHIFNDKTAPLAQPTQNPLSSTAWIPYSSGTTGPPKGVAVSHGALTSNCASFHDLWPHLSTSANEQTTVMGFLPFYHIFGKFVINMLSLYAGAKIVSLPAFTPHDFVRVIREHKVDVLHLVPPLLNFLVTSPVVSSADLTSVRVAMVAAAPVLPTVAAKLKEKAGNHLFFQEAFGMTETLATHVTPIGDERLGFCGKTIPNCEVKIVDIDTGKSLPPETRGEMCIRSPGLMSHYHNNMAATAKAVDTDGWFHTGDIAVYNSDNFFSIVDRIKELIKVKGLQVSPSELEDTILQIPGVSDVGVVGVEDERAGELPRAYVVCDVSITEEMIRSHMMENLAPYKQAAGGVRFVKELPKNPTGKLLRKELKRIAQED